MDIIKLEEKLKTAEDRKSHTKRMLKDLELQLSDSEKQKFSLQASTEKLKA